MIVFCLYGKIPDYRLVLYYRPGRMPAVMMSQQWRLGNDLGLVNSSTNGSAGNEGG
jgi:hypothetical protein